MTAATRKARQRERDRAAGYTRIEFRVPVDRAEEVKALVARLVAEKERDR